MDGQKSYQVNYLITSEAKGAVDQIKLVGSAAETVQSQVTTLTTAIQTLQKNIGVLKSDLALKFEPTIETTAFNSKLQEMVRAVRTAAIEMQNALYSALTGKGPIREEVSKTIGKTLQKQSSEAIKSQIAHQQAIISAIRGPESKRTSHGNYGKFSSSAAESTLARYFGLGDKDAFDRELKAAKEAEGKIKDLQKVLQKVEKEEQKAVTNYNKAVGAATGKQASGSSAAQPLAITNKAISTLTEQLKAINDAKKIDVTVNLIDNLTGKLGGIKSELSGLQKQGEVIITPILNPEALAAAKTQLKAISESPGVKPVGTPQQQEKLAALGQKIASAEQRKAANEAIQKAGNAPKNITALIGADKARIAKWSTEKAALENEIAKSGTGLVKQGGMAGENMVTILLKTQPSIETLRTQLKEIGIPQPEVILNITPAESQIAALKEQISGLGGQVGAINVAPTGKTGGNQSVQTINGNAGAGNTSTSSGASNGNNQSSGKGGKAVAELKSPKAQDEAYIQQVTKDHQKLKERIASQERAERKKLAQQEAKERYATAKANAKAETQRQQEIRKSISENSAARHAARNVRMANALLPYTQGIPSSLILDNGKEAIAAARSVNILPPTVRSASDMSAYLRGLTSISGAQKLDFLLSFAGGLDAAGKPIPAKLYNEIAKMQQESGQGGRAKPKSTAAKSGYARVRSMIKNKTGLADFYNSLLPYKLSDAELNTLFANRAHFKKAIQTTGITPAPDMGAYNMLQYLKGVSEVMQQRHVEVPKALRSAIERNERQLSKGEGSAGGGFVGGSSREQNFIKQLRKSAFPLTGVTSFGQRTPMAVGMAKGMGVMFAISGAIEMIMNSFKQSTEYQNTMRATQSILQHGTKTYSLSGFKDMEGIIRDVGIKTKFSAPEVASAAKFLAMAGYDIPAINNAIRPIADIALIGGTDLGETADKITNIMTTFGIDPARMREVANIMTTTATRSNTDVMMLAESAKYGGGVANMYNGNDPNLLADTMAIFGVMGNAGIQASSAGTALRMMYQNVFKPNKNQKKVLDMLDSQYGIKTLTEDGGFRSMSDIILEMAQKIPAKEQASIIGQLFRITAQPGANAAIQAGAARANAEALMETAQKEGFDPEEAAKGLEVMSDILAETGGLSKLAELMRANRRNATGTLASDVAGDQQKTLQGLWAQVTSTFTEGIVKAMEGREGYLQQTLASLRDYLAEPKTVEMLHNLFDLIVKVVGIMAKFADIWASIYSMFPDIVSGWITLQMVFTNIGYLIAPLVSLVGGLAGLKNTFQTLTGIGVAGGAAEVAKNAATTNKIPVIPSPMPAPMPVQGGKTAPMPPIMPVAKGGSPMPPVIPAPTPAPAAPKPVGRIRAGWQSGRAFGKNAVKYLTLSNLFAMIGNGLKSLTAGLAKFVGAIWSPLGALGVLTVGFGGLAYGLFKINQRIRGTSDAQLEALEKMNKAAANSNKYIHELDEWYKSSLTWHAPKPIEFNGQSDELEQRNRDRYNKSQERFQQITEAVSELTNNPSENSINKFLSEQHQEFENNRLLRLAAGEYYDQWMGSGLDQNPSDVLPRKNMYYGRGGATIKSMEWLNYFLYKNEKRAQDIQNNAIPSTIVKMALADENFKELLVKSNELAWKYGNKEIDELTYQKEGKKILANLLSPSNKNVIPLSEIDTLEGKTVTWLSKTFPWVYAQYSALSKVLGGADGTLLAQIFAERELTDYHQHPQWSQEWWKTVGNYTQGWSGFVETGTDKGKVLVPFTNFANGKIDFNQMLKEVEDKAPNYSSTLPDLAKLAATLFKYLEANNIVSGKDMSTFVWQQMKGYQPTYEQAVEYYKANNLMASEYWGGQNNSADMFAKYVTGQITKDQLNQDARAITNSMQQMRDAMLMQVVKSVVGEMPNWENPVPKNLNGFNPPTLNEWKNSGILPYIDQSAYRPAWKQGKENSFVSNTFGDINIDININGDPKESGFFDKFGKEVARSIKNAFIEAADSTAHKF